MTLNKITRTKQALRLTLAAAIAAAWAANAAAIGFHGGGMGGGFRGGGAMPMGGGFRGGMAGASPSVGAFRGGTGGGFIGGASPNFAGGPAARGLATYGGMGLPANIEPNRMPPNSANRFGNLYGFDHGGIPALSPRSDARDIVGQTPTSAEVGNFLGLKDGGPQLGSLRSELDRNPVLPDNPLTRSGGSLPAENRVAPPSLNPADDPLLRGGSWTNGYAGKFPSWSGGKTPEALSKAGRINDNVGNVVGPNGPRADQMHNWVDNHPERAQQWQTRADQVRQNWDQNHPWHNGVRPGSDWWSKYHPDLDHWYYHHGWYNRSWRYWWGYPSWIEMGAWFPWWVGAAPIYYDYGVGGNVVYQNQNVYVNGQDVGSTTDYAESAANLATVDPSQAEAAASDEQWLPLGTFAVETSPTDVSTSRLLQLAVDKQGIISGTMYNASTDKLYVVQGRVDKQTQRAAFTIGDKSDVVMETGIYNLTQKQTPVLVHFGTDKTETYLLVRLEAPKDAGGDNNATDADAAGNQPAENPLSP